MCFFVRQKACAPRCSIIILLIGAHKGPLALGTVHTVGTRPLIWPKVAATRELDSSARAPPPIRAQLDNRAHEIFALLSLSPMALKWLPVSKLTSFVSSANNGAFCGQPTSVCVCVHWPQATSSPSARSRDFPLGSTFILHKTREREKFGQAACGAPRH